MKINVVKLMKELQAAGIEASGCNGNGVVWGLVGEQIQDRADIAAVIAAHDPNPTAAELATITRKANAKAEARLAAELRTLTPQQAVNYIDANVTTIASAKVVLKVMARMMIAMRDEVWPDLPE